MDANTIQCKVVSRVTYVPIPFGSGGSFAGLFSVDLPAGISVGQEFNVVVRRITTKQISAPPAPPQIQRGKGAAVVSPQVVILKQLVWRYVTGSFLIKIPVQKERNILPVDENLLAVLKWRLGQIGTGNRWYPVLVRWLAYLAARIIAMGGDPGKIRPSPTGYQPPTKGPGQPAGTARRCCTGKVAELVYDCFGDFQGFELRGCECEGRFFRACEPDIERLIYRAWEGRFTVTVCACPRDASKVESVTLLRARAR